MSNRPTPLTNRLYDYFLKQSLREPEVMARLRAETALLPYANMQIAPEQGQFMAFLAELTGARKAIEIGTFTGYSALAIVLGMGASGRLVACDTSAEWTTIARRYWAEAGVAERIALRLAPALDTLAALETEGESGSFDFAFIDADKANYDNYFESCLKLLRPGGLIAIDNVFWDGRVADPGADDPDTRAIRALNAKLHRDPRVALSMVPIGDGLTLALKRH
ncbi:MAG: class I SAM-dependent methyltransferase [Alphaproteobacteria bacterium]